MEKCKLQLNEELLKKSLASRKGVSEDILLFEKQLKEVSKQKVLF